MTCPALRSACPLLMQWILSAQHPKWTPTARRRTRKRSWFRVRKRRTCRSPSPASSQAAGRGSLLGSSSLVLPASRSSLYSNLLVDCTSESFHHAYRLRGRVCSKAAILRERRVSVAERNDGRCQSVRCQNQGIKKNGWVSMIQIMLQSSVSTPTIYSPARKIREHPSNVTRCISRPS